MLLERPATVAAPRSPSGVDPGPAVELALGQLLRACAALGRELDQMDRRTRQHFGGRGPGVAVDHPLYWGEPDRHRRLRDDFHAAVGLALARLDACDAPAALVQASEAVCTALGQWQEHLLGLLHYGSACASLGVVGPSAEQLLVWVGVDLGATGTAFTPEPLRAWASVLVRLERSPRCTAAVIATLSAYWGEAAERLEAHARSLAAEATLDGAGEAWLRREAEAYACEADRLARPQTPRPRSPRLPETLARLRREAQPTVLPTELPEARPLGPPDVAAVPSSQPGDPAPRGTRGFFPPIGPAGLGRVGRLSSAVLRVRDRDPHRGPSPLRPRERLQMPAHAPPPRRSGATAGPARALPRLPSLAGRSLLRPAAPTAASHRLAFDRLADRIARGWAAHEALPSARRPPPAYEHLCPISGEGMARPVYATDPRLCFDEPSILTWLADHPTCPLSRRPLGRQQLRENHVLQQEIASWLRAQGAEPGDSPRPSLWLRLTRRAPWLRRAAGAT